MKRALLEALSLSLAYLFRVRQRGAAVVALAEIFVDVVVGARDNRPNAEDRVLVFVVLVDLLAQFCPFANEANIPQSKDVVRDEAILRNKSAFRTGWHNHRISTWLRRRRMERALGLSGAKEIL